MLPKIHRLTKKKDIDAVLRKGRSFRYGAFTLKVLENKLKVSRFAFIVGKKAASKAVVRNRVRRVVREGVRQKLQSLVRNVDAVIIVRGPTSDDFTEISLVLKTLFARSGLL